MTALYSLHSQRPAPPPFRITLPSGFTRTDPSTFTAEEIADAGYTGPYIEPPYDPTTQALDWIDGAYVIRDLPPPQPEPAWLAFSTTLMADPAVNTMLGALLTAAPGLYGGLSVGLNEASKGDTRLFLSAWSATRQLGLIPAELLTTIGTLATTCNLPADFTVAITRPFAQSVGQEWTAPDGSQWQVVQARDPQGQFLADDPATSARESLEWELVA